MNTVNHPSLFKQLVDALPFGVYVLRFDGTVQYANRAAEEISGYPSPEAVARNCADILACCDLSGTSSCHGSECPLIAVVREGPNSTFSLTINQRDGARVPILVRTVPLPGEEGASSAALCFRGQQSQDCEVSWIEENESQIDPALGIYSAETTERQLRSIAADGVGPVAVFSIELAHVDELIRKHGREMVRLALRTLIHSFRRILPMPHYLGKWKNSALLLLVSPYGLNTCSELRSALATVGNGCAVMWWGDRVPLRVRVRCSLSCVGDSVDSVLARLAEDEVPGEVRECS